MAELGQTEDPTELVPGSPGTVEEHARSLTGFGERTAAVGDGLGKVDVLSWVGAAAEGFRSRFAEEPPRWHTAGDALSTSATSLGRYADTLRWAQSQAQEAIELWKQAKAESAKHQEAIEEFEDGPTAPITPDPGEAYREQARDLLDRARKQLDDVGIDTQGSISELLGELSKKRPIEGELFGIEYDGYFQGPNAGWRVDPPSTSIGSGSPGEYGLGGTFTAFANLWNLEMNSATSIAGVDVDNKFTANSGIQISPTGAVSKNGFALGLAGSAGLNLASETTSKKGPVTMKHSGTGFLGADFDGGISGSQDGTKGKVGWFGGGKVGSGVSAGAGGIELSAKAEGWAGFGQEAGYTFGKGGDGKWHVGANAGAASVLGGKLGGEIAVDPEAAYKTATGAGKAIRGWF